MNNFFFNLKNKKQKKKKNKIKEWPTWGIDPGTLAWCDSAPNH